MVDATQAKVMQYCRNWFAVLCERVTAAHVSGATVTSDKFEGHYTAGMLLRIHGAYSMSYAEFRAGECYEVVSFIDGVLTLDHDMHTQAPNLFIVVCEPTGEFKALCADIATYEAKAAGRDGLSGESIGGYSWSAGASGTTFAQVFADKLAPYRMLAPTPLYYAKDAQAWL